MNESVTECCLTLSSAQYNSTEWPALFRQVQWYREVSQPALQWCIDNNLVHLIVTSNDVDTLFTCKFYQYIAVSLIWIVRPQKFKWQSSQILLNTTLHFGRATLVILGHFEFVLVTSLYTLTPQLKSHLDPLFAFDASGTVRVWIICNHDTMMQCCIRYESLYSVSIVRLFVQRFTMPHESLCLT